ncbi:hypothetical protein BU23DRAFT_552903 [Bimuria novae-zelandiae CBS 107.79]|uniref:Uncharacterized protein n=1 Tax=Bimuria novae-zelandiae CBS 107.79 TaxID=1447943 RepID=A0A6A5VED1_9PLEO|nr:hypothetical protein BU23DRAFT_552903 [Bimuria novae-zelandiae CBS 107.79]
MPTPKPPSPLQPPVKSTQERPRANEQQPSPMQLLTTSSFAVLGSDRSSPPPAEPQSPRNQPAQKHAQPSAVMVKTKEIQSVPERSAQSHAQPLTVELMLKSYQELGKNSEQVEKAWNQFRHQFEAGEPNWDTLSKICKRVKELILKTNKLREDWDTIGGTEVSYTA